MPDTGNALNGLFLSGDGISKTTYTYPLLRVAPRFGMAYDLTGNQQVVFRGGGGLFYDRPNGNDIYAQVTNPPAVQNVTVRYAQLQALSSGLSTVGAPTLNTYQYDAQLPSSWQWNGGVQMMLPWSTSLDLAYTGQHSWATPQAVNINACRLAVFSGVMERPRMTREKAEGIRENAGKNAYLKTCAPGIRVARQAGSAAAASATAASNATTAA